MNMREVVEAIDRATAGKRVYVATGVGTHQSIVARHFTWDYPDRMFLSSCGHGTMGSGLPYLMGTWLADPSRIPILITGDGSFAMEAPGLKTLEDYGIPARIFVLDNHAFGIVHQFESLQGIDHIATERPSTEWAIVAMGYGATSWAPDLEHVDRMIEAPEFSVGIFEVDDIGVWPILEAGRMEMTHE